MTVSEQPWGLTYVTRTLAAVVLLTSPIACGAGPDAPAPEAVRETPANDGPTTGSAEPAEEGDVPRGLRSNTPEVSPGYVLFAALVGDTTYLVDTEGRAVHTWQSDYAPASAIYLLDNGHLLRGAREQEADVFLAGGRGGRLEEFSWDGELVWSFRFASRDHLLHHDVEVLPNGNILAIAWERKTAEEANQVGLRPDLTPEQGVWPDMVIEIEPQPPDGARIVWEWHLWDHTVQALNSTLPNYGEPSEHPELVDLNGKRDPLEVSAEEMARLQALGYVPTDATPDDLSSDLLHTNAIAYNASLDQIALSVPEYSEIWVIDHGTTTAEAAGHTGGRWGRGGDLLYRWGNPRIYGRGDADDERLGFQHDVRWVPEGMPGAGHLMLFNNRLGGDDDPHSAIWELAPSTDDQGRYVIQDGKPFGPETLAWSYTAPDKVSFYSSFISGAHRLENGHTFVTSGAQGRLFEITMGGEIVWEYWSPYSGALNRPERASPPYSVFRATKIPPEHAALAGRDLSPLAPQPPVGVPTNP